MELSSSEQDDLKKILIAFFGETATSWNMNEKVLELTIEMLQRNEQCSKWMDVVPRPGVYVNANAVRHMIAAIASRVIQRQASGDLTYKLCQQFLSYHWETVLRAASMGL